MVRARGLNRYTLIDHFPGGVLPMLYAHHHHDELERPVLVHITRFQ